MIFLTSLSLDNNDISSIDEDDRIDGNRCEGRKLLGDFLKEKFES